MSKVQRENTMPDPPNPSRVRLLLLMIPDSLLHGMSILEMPSSETPHAEIPVANLAKYPLIARIASIGTGYPPHKHGVHTFMRFDEATGTLQPRRSEDIGVPWIWDIVQRSGRTTTTIDWPLINDTVGSNCLNVLNVNAAEADAVKPDDLLETLSRHLDNDLLTLALNLNPRGEERSQQIDSEGAQNVIKTIIERLEPKSSGDHLIVYVTAGKLECLFLFGQRAGDITKKIVCQSDLPATVLDLLDVEKTVDIPGHSVFDAIDDEKTPSHWPSFETAANNVEPIESAIKSVLEGEKDATVHVLNWLTSSWICSARHHGVTHVELRYAQLLNDLRGKAMDMFRLATSADLLDEPEAFKIARDRLQTEYPGSVPDTLAGTLAAADPTIDQLRAAVDGTDPSSMLPALARAWCDAAMRAGLNEEASEHLAPLVFGGMGLPRDRVLLADYYMNEKSPQKALRALGLLGTSPAKHPQLTVIRAKILLKCDRIDAAQKLLKAILENTPIYPEARSLLDAIESRSED